MFLFSRNKAILVCDDFKDLKNKQCLSVLVPRALQVNVVMVAFIEISFVQSPSIFDVRGASYVDFAVCDTFDLVDSRMNADFRLGHGWALQFGRLEQ